jgi:hypothetical protein
MAPGYLRPCWVVWCPFGSSTTRTPTPPGANRAAGGGGACGKRIRVWEMRRCNAGERRLQAHSSASNPGDGATSAHPEPLSWLKPGGSGRDHRSLGAAAAHVDYTSALESIDWRPFRKRPTLTRDGPWRPAKGGRKFPAPRGLVGNGLLVRRLQGGLPPRPRPMGAACIEQGCLWINEAC